MRTPDQQISIIDLQRLVIYTPETALLIWNERRPDDFKQGKRHTPSEICDQWNAKNAFNECFISPNRRGYLNGRLRGLMYKRHRIIWAHHTGAWPIGIIDHIDGDRGNCCFENLRDVSHADNGRNRFSQRNNKSGRIGVCFDRRVGLWRAYIGLNGKTIRLGLCETFDQAVALRAASEREHGFFDNGAAL